MIGSLLLCRLALSRGRLGLGGILLQLKLLILLRDGLVVEARGRRLAHQLHRLG